MIVTHYSNYIYITIDRGENLEEFCARPINKKYTLGDIESTEVDFFNWEVEMPNTIANECGKDKLVNQNFHSIEEIKEYIKKFEDPGSEDIERDSKFRGPF